MNIDVVSIAWCHNRGGLSESSAGYLPDLSINVMGHIDIAATPACEKFATGSAGIVVLVREKTSVVEDRTGRCSLTISIFPHYVA
jgi:hypothetical protein